MATSPFCPRCGYVHYGTEVRAVGRFDRGGPRGYRLHPDGPLRRTRAEAKRDACDRNLARADAGTTS